MSGNLPDSWALATITDFTANERHAIKRGPFGSTLKKSLFVPAGVKIYEQQHAIQNDFTLGDYFISEAMFDELRAFEVKPGDLIISCSGTIGKIAIVPLWAEKGIINQALLKLTLDPRKIDSRFFIWQFQFESARIVSSNARGSGMNNLAGVKELKEVRFALPPPKEQERIVTKIDELFSDLDAGVAVLERAKAKLKRYRAAVLKAAVEGKLTAAWRTAHPDVETASKLIQRILADRRGKWEQGQLAKIATSKKSPPTNWQARYVEPALPDTTNSPDMPDTWALGSMDQLSTIITSGSRDWTKYYGSGTGTFLMAQNVRPGKLDRQFRQAVDPPLDDRDRMRSQVQSDDLLVTIVGANTGDVCRVPDELVEHYVCQSVALMRPVERRLAKYVELYFVEKYGGQQHYRRYIYGQGRPHLSFDQLRMTPVSIPPLAEQTEIVAQVAEKLSQIEAAEAAIDHGLARAARLRQSILKLAFSGHLVPQDPLDEPASALLKRIETSNNSGASLSQRSCAKRKNTGKANRLVESISNVYS